MQAVRLTGPLRQCTQRSKRVPAHLVNSLCRNSWPRLTRAQHDNHGPHKEYFQVPGRAPRPDFTPYERATPQTTLSSNTFSNVDSSVQQNSAPPHPGSGSVRRIFRNLSSMIVFACLGFGASTALITWDYLAPLPEHGSEDEAAILEELEEAMDDHPLLESLREGDWRELDMNTYSRRQAAAGGAKSRTMLYDSLAGPKGLIGTKMFFHKEREFSLMVFSTGFAIDGWPDVIHGGITSALVQEATETHLNTYHQDVIREVVEQKLTIDFKTPVRPGEVYAILVPGVSMQATSELRNNRRVKTVKAVGLLVQLDGAPTLESSYDAKTRVMEHRIGLPKNSFLGFSEPFKHFALGTLELSVLEDGAVLDAPPTAFDIVAPLSKVDADDYKD